MLSNRDKQWRFCATAIALVAIAGCSGPIGENFQDVDSIGMSETWDAWVIVGRFGTNGPFELAEIKECDYSEPCSFSHNGTGHTYDKFYGYKLTILRLEGANV